MKLPAAAGIPITEVIGLRSKMYSYLKDNNKGDQKAKGAKMLLKKNLNMNIIKILCLITNKLNINF